MKAKEALGVLDNFLMENRPAILAMKSFSQLANSMPVDLTNPGLKVLDEMIKEFSNGKLSYLNGGLLLLWDDKYALQTYDNYQSLNYSPHSDFTRGMYYDFKIGGTWFQCIDLDLPVKGAHRLHFDSKSSKDKAKLLRDFAIRNETLDDQEDIVIKSGNTKLTTGYISIMTVSEREFRMSLMADFQHNFLE